MLQYCIHHLVHVRIDGEGTSADVVNEMLQALPNECDSPARVIDVTVGDRPPHNDMVELTFDHRLRSGVRFEMGPRGPMILMPRDPGRSRWMRHHVLMLCRIELLARGATIVKAAALSYEGAGILIPGVRGAGKTSAALLPAIDDRFSFMSDDVSIIRDDGTLLGFPKPLLIRHFQLEDCEPELRDVLNRTVPDVQRGGKGRKSLARAGADAIVNRLGGRPPRPPSVHAQQRATPADLFPDGARASTAPARAMLFIRPGPAAIEELDEVQAASYLTAMALHTGIAPLIQEYALADAIDATRFPADVTEVVRAFVRRVPVRLRLTIEPGSPRSLRAVLADVVSGLDDGLTAGDAANGVAGS